jgi:amino acid transporter
MDLIAPQRLVGVLVIAVNFVSAFAIFTQIRLTHRRKNTIGLSWFAWLMGTTNAFVGTIYSFLIADLVFVLANLAWLTVNGTMLALIFYYGKFLPARRRNLKPQQE